MNYTNLKLTREQLLAEMKAKQQDEAWRTEIINLDIPQL